MNFPGINFPDMPDCTGLVKAGERLMKVAADELPRAVDALERLAAAKTSANAIAADANRRNAR